MDAILTALPYLVSALLAVLGYKGGEYGISKFKSRGQKEIEPVTQSVCELKHNYLENKLENISKDIAEVKVSLEKLIELQIGLVKLSSDLRHENDEKMSHHIDSYHKVA